MTESLDDEINEAIEAFFTDQEGSNAEALRRQLQKLGLRIVRDLSEADQ